MKTKKGLILMVIAFLAVGFLIAQTLIRKEATVTISVLEARDFNLVIGNPPIAGGIHRGEVWTVPVEVYYLNGYLNNVRLSAENVPAGMTVVFERDLLVHGTNPATGELMDMTNMIVTIAIDATLGELSFTVVGQEEVVPVV